MKQSDSKKPAETEKCAENPKPDRGILQPMVDEMTKPKPASEPAKAPVPPPPHQPAEQDQDSGGGYNPDHTVPQP